MTEEVKVRYTIEDQLSKGLKDISDESKDASKSLEEMAVSTGKVTAAFGGMALAGAAAIGSTIALSDKQEIAERRVEQTIKSTGSAAGFTGEQIKAMASEMQKATVYGDEDVLGAQNMLLTFTNINNDVFPKTLDAVADISSAMGTDLQSTAIQIGKAINDPVTGLASLSRIGITFSEEQKGIIKNLVSIGDTASAQGIILNTLQEQFGGQAKITRDTFTGTITAMGNYLFDSLEAVGKASKEFLKPYLDVVDSAVRSISDFITENAGLVAGILIAGTAIAGAIATITGFVTVVLSAQLAWVALNTALATFSLAWGTVIMPILVAAAPIIGGIALALGTLYLAWDEITIIATAVSKAVMIVIESIQGFVTELIDTIVWAFETEAPGLFNFFTSLWEDLKIDIEAITNGILMTIKQIIDAYKNAKDYIKGSIGMDISEDVRGEKMLNRSGSSESKTSVESPADMIANSLMPTSGSSFISGSRPQGSEAQMDNWVNTRSGRIFAENNPGVVDEWRETDRSGASLLGLSEAQQREIYLSGYDIQKRVNDSGQEYGFITKDSGSIGLIEAVASQGPRYPIQGGAY